MGILGRMVYGALVRREEKLAKISGGIPPWKLSPDKHGHLVTGRHGESLAFWYLRCNGYTMVARNRREGQGLGELDMIGWDGRVLAFIEVKTRTTDEAGPPEAALQPSQRQRIVRAAEQYMRRLRIRPASYRFDVASVSWHPERGFSVRVIKNAFDA